MPYCPKCGKEVLADDLFCLNCGQSLGRLSGWSPPPQNTQLVPPVPATNASNLYLIGERGFHRIGTWFPLVSVPVILGVALGLVVVLFFRFGNLVAMSTIIALIIAPVFGGYRARRLASYVRLSEKELVSRQEVRTIPWSSIEHIRIKGSRLAFRLGNAWVSSTIDGADAARLGQKASSLLGGNFTNVPENPPRFSPIMKFTLLTAALFLVTEGITLAASLTPFFAGEQDQYTNLYNTVRAGLGPTIYQQWASIFLNNVQVALAGAVPGFGSLVLGLSSYNTGRVIQAAAIHFNVSPTTFLTLLFVLPHTWVEELSYPLAGALGLYMFTWRHQSYAEFSRWRTRASTKVAFGFAFVALLLAIASALEVSEPDLGIGALLLWAPVVAGAIYAYLKLKTRIGAALS